MIARARCACRSHGHAVQTITVSADDGHVCVMHRDGQPMQYLTNPASYQFNGAINSGTLNLPVRRCADCILPFERD